MSLALALVLAPACSLVTVQQDPFEPLDVTAKAPPPKPPRVVLTASSIKISEKVQFKLGSAELLPDSFGLLDEVAGVMRDNSQIERLQIEGHTDSTGSAKINKKLSKERAESVRAYLMKKGIEDKRMVAVGFGPDKPIADNTTPDGQEANRRVEFNIVKQGPKKTVVEDE
jgi:outer membrane protein OmpA-like peptidoglycan-associated protein